MSRCPYWRDRTEVYRYTEGTMNVDLVDAGQNRLVWEGMAVGRVGRGTPEERGREDRCRGGRDLRCATRTARAAARRGAP